MYIHKQFLKEHIGRDKGAQNAFAFFLLLKKYYPDSTIYNTTSFKSMARVCGMDERTVRKRWADCLNRGWIKPWGEHKKLKSINKEYEYRTLENGKKDVRKNSKYLTISLKLADNIKQLRSLIRALLVKPLYQSKLYTKFGKERRDKLSTEEKQQLYNSAYKSGKKLRVANCEAFAVAIPLSTIGKIMGVSKSTAERTLMVLNDIGLSLKKTGERKRGCRVEDIPDHIKKLNYGTFVFDGRVFKKTMNSYVF